MDRMTEGPNDSQQQPPRRDEPPAAPPVARGPCPPPIPAQRPAPPPADPFEPAELRRALTRPHLLFETVLGSKDRLAVTLGAGRAVWLLVAILLAVSLAAPVPYGLLSPTASAWRVAMLYVGSLAICFPCLHAFGQFLGLQINLGRTLALSLVITAAAGLFAFAFAPIIWFLDYSMAADECTRVSPASLSVML
ncbi:MAG TPA: hypothetical protein VNA25_17370, partial [Phycisphaerae bacterium]|nr:hypothetical protein [Phycisphaerae bacterium]